MTFSLKILGSNSATPAYGRNHTSQLLQVNKHHMLIDCGEGTQIQLAKYKGKPLRINHIFISHLHGDHYLGLMGLIFTMHLLRRTVPLYIYGPKGLSEIITSQLKYSETMLNYDIEFRETVSNESELLFEDKFISVSSFPLSHRIPCTGFLFKEKPKPPRINKEKLPGNISLAQIGALKKGKDLTDKNGNLLFRNADLTLPPRKSRAYAYCSDTKYDESILPYISGVDLLYHETTFVEGKEKWANETFHSTTKQAGAIAKMGGVEKLLIGHYSARYRDLSIFLDEVQQVFGNAALAIEGDVIEVPDL